MIESPNEERQRAQLSALPNDVLPLRVPMVIEYRKGGARVARSLCFVLAQKDGLVIAAATLDGKQPMGIVTIDESAIVRAVRLDERAA